MGCGASSDMPEGKGKGKKGKGKKGVGKKPKSKNTTDSDDESEAVMIVDEKPEVLRKQISKVAKAIADKRDKLKPQAHGLLNEKRGLESMLEEERNKLTKLAEQKAALEAEREQLMTACWNADADDLYRAFDARDKKAQVLILTTRTNWQLNEIGKVYTAKYGELIQNRIVTDGQRALGKIFTGSLTNLCKLLTYRVMPQPERDAAFMKDFLTSGMSIQDENLLEIVMTRSNSDLQKALEWYVEEYGTSVKDALKSHSYKNYRDFMEKVFECNRDEFDEPFDDATAEKLAADVYAAGAGRTIGIAPEVFVNTFAQISKAQFESLNAKYAAMHKGRQLLKDIDSKVGGDFAMAIKIRCTDKFEYLASRLALALKSSFSTDKEAICRILGCCARWECAKVKEAYDKASNGRSLEAALKNCCSSEPNFLRAMTLLISGDASLTPMGSDRELLGDEAEATRAGRRARSAAEEKYDRKRIQAAGEETYKARRGMAGGLFSGDPDNDDIPAFDINAKGRSNDLADLSSALRQAQEVSEKLDIFKDGLKDEVTTLKESYLSLNSHCYEMETWIAIFKGHIRSLKVFNEARAKKDSAFKDWKG